MFYDYRMEVVHVIYTHFTCIVYTMAPFANLPATQKANNHDNVLRIHNLRPSIRPPRRYADEQDIVKRHARAKNKAKHGKYWPVDVMDYDIDTEKYFVHYIGYAHRYDEWVPNTQMKDIVFRKEQDNIIIKELFELIQKNLTIGRGSTHKTEISVPCNKAQFSRIFPARKRVNLGPRIYGCGRKSTYKVYTLKSFRCVDNLFNRDWEIRILNRNGDHAKLFLPTLRMWVARPRCITRRMTQGRARVDRYDEKDNVKRAERLYVSFVREFGSKHDLQSPRN